jgi:hypothetical protein
MKILLYFFVTLISTSAFAQSTLHPGKMGAGYYYLHSISEEFSTDANTFYFSTGHIDISFFVSNTKIEQNRLLQKSKNVQNLGLNVGITSVKEGKRILPTMNLSIGSAAEKLVFLALGPSMAFIVFDDENYRIYPEAGVLITFLGLDSSDNFQTEVSFGTDLVIAFHLRNAGFLILQPGYSTSKSIHYFSLAGGISFLL